MAIDTFTKDEFMQALLDIALTIEEKSGNYHHVRTEGIEMGEWVFTLHIDWRISILIRSSIGESGLSDGVGENSIRLWMQHTQAKKMISKLPMNYVTRVKGWEKRLSEYINKLISYRLLSGDCPKCDHPMYVYRTKKPNKTGLRRLFASCFACDDKFFWLEDVYGNITSPPTPYFLEESGIEVKSEVAPPSDDETPNSFVSASISDSAEENVIPDPEPVRDNDVELAGPAESSSADLSDELEKENGNENEDKTKDSVDIFDTIDEMEKEESDLQANSMADSALLDKAHDPNPEQLAAISLPLESAARVIAPPGAGKTFLLVRRLQYLVDSGVDIRNIGAVAFNVKMAETLRVRFLQLMPSDWNGRAEVERNISTIHAMCFRMLKESGDRRRIPERAYWKIKKFIQDFVIDYFPNVEEQPNHKEILGWIYTSRNQGIPITQIGGFYISAMDRTYAEFMSEIHIAYTEFMKKNNWLMFGDMLYDVEMKLIDNPAFRNHWQQMYKYIVIDEGQDVNGQAMRILTTLAAPQDNFFIVGDPDQLLYRFTGATPETNLFDGFEKRFPDAETIMLRTNYRSTINIINTTSKLIKRNYSDMDGPYDEKFHKVVDPREKAEVGASVDYILYKDQAQESEKIVDSIVEQISLGVDPGQIFVGARTRAQLAFLEGGLIRKEIPYINTAGEVFWNSRHVGDVMAFLNLAYDNNDDKSFAKIFNIASKDFTHPFGEMKGQYCPHHYLGRKFLDVCSKDYKKVTSAVRGYRWPWKFVMKAGSEDLVQFIDEIACELSMGNASTAISYIISQCYQDYLVHETGIESDADGGPFQDLAMLMYLAQTMETTREFIDYVDEAAQRVRDANNGTWAGKVILSTVHGLKGLERDVVYGIGLCEGTSYKNNEEQPYGLLPHTFSMREPPHHGVLPSGGQARMEDERCIAFVLVSRAAEQVFLSGFKMGADSVLRPSRFVEEMSIHIDEEDEN